MCRGCREPNAHFTHRCAVCHCLFISGTTRHYNAHAKGSRHLRRLPKLQLVDPQFVDPGVQPIDAPGRHPCAICRKSFDDGAWATHDASNAHQMNLWRLQRPQGKAVYATTPPWDPEMTVVAEEKSVEYVQIGGNEVDEMAEEDDPANADLNTAVNADIPIIHIKSESEEEENKGNTGGKHDVSDSDSESGSESEEGGHGEEQSAEGPTKPDIQSSSNERNADTQETPGSKPRDTSVFGSCSESENEGNVFSTGQQTSQKKIVIEEADTQQSVRVETAFDAIVKKRSPHIFRLVELNLDLRHLLVQGRQYLLNSSSSLSDRDLSSFEILCNFITGLREELLHISEQEAVELANRMFVPARNNRGSDVHRAKSTIIDILKSVYRAMDDDESELLADKSKRGFANDKTGEMLCPVDLDWQKNKVRRRLRKGKIKPSANEFMRGLYKDCVCNREDYEDGLLRNEVLVLMTKCILLGPRQALKQRTATSKAVKNAEVAGVRYITPRVIAYCACMLRYSISDQESWSIKDGEFDLTEMYWSIVDIFDGSESANELLRWWNSRIFGSGQTSSAKRPPSTLELLKAQRAAKRARAETGND